jgi:hypothetical protein
MKRIRMEKNTAKTTNLPRHPHSSLGSSFPADEQRIGPKVVESELKAKITKLESCKPRRMLKAFCKK